MLLMGGLGGWLRQAEQKSGQRGAFNYRWRQRGVAFAGAFIVLLGLITFARGVFPIGGHLHGL
jgi:hypothetical protein